MYFALQLLCRHREAVISVCKKLETEWAMSWVTKGLTCKNGEVSKAATPPKQFRYLSTI